MPQRIKRISEAVPVDVQNVHEYLDQMSKDGKSKGFVETCPHLAPPFRMAWFEWSEADTRRTMGALVTSEKRDENFSKEELSAFVKATGTTPEAASAQFVSEINTVVEDGTDRTFYLYPLTKRLYIDGTGNLVAWSVFPTFKSRQWETLEALKSAGAEISQLGLWKAMEAITARVGLATSFMHAKNVVIRDNEPPERLQRARRRRGRPPMVTYKTLEIEPMKRVLKTEGCVDEVGLKQALHICRGHFKDYRERGLFGRETHKGIYWWDMHVRGDAMQGSVVKDYKVNAPS